MFQPFRYEVTGAAPVLDHEPGSVFEADLDPIQEQRLIDGGHLRKLPPADEPDVPRLDDPQPEGEEIGDA